ncbi:MAG TPA: helix-turn-helix domain-containing protein [Acidimicrobiales bacterium]|nr:helix-turn-helix domain-containing protein [Acidimicrobiales bacterium]
MGWADLDLGLETAAPVPDGTVVTGTAVVDAGWAPGPEPGHVVLLVGVGPDDAVVDTLVRRAGLARAAAMVVRSPAPLPPSLVQVARASGVGLLRMPTSLAWDDVHDVVAAQVAGGDPSVALVRRRAVERAARADAIARVRARLDRAGSEAGERVACFAGERPLPGAAIELVRLSAGVLDPDACAAAIGPRLYLVCTLADDVLIALARRAVVLAADAFGLTMGAGIGHSRAQADAAADLAGPAVAHFDGVRTQAVLAALDHLAEHVAGPHACQLELLRQRDEQRGTGYLDTLLAWFDAAGDVASAAGRLRVHTNTFRYRLRRIAALSGIDLGDPDERLALELQLRIPAWRPPTKEPSP